MSYLEILKNNVQDPPTPKTVPGGKYLALCTRVNFNEYKSDPESGLTKLEYKLISPVSGQDVTGIPIEKPRAYLTIWASKSKNPEETLSRLNKWALKLRPSSHGQPLQDTYESCHGEKFIVEIKPRMTPGKTFPELDVINVEPA